MGTPLSSTPGSSTLKASSSLAPPVLAELLSGWDGHPIQQDRAAQSNSATGPDPQPTISPERVLAELQSGWDRHAIQQHKAATPQRQRAQLGRHRACAGGTVQGLQHTLKVEVDSQERVRGSRGALSTLQ